MSWLEKAKKLQEAMTAGPWKLRHFYTSHPVRGEKNGMATDIGPDPHPDTWNGVVVHQCDQRWQLGKPDGPAPDSEGIAFLRNSLPELLALVEANRQLTDEIARLEEATEPGEKYRAQLAVDKAWGTAYDAEKALDAKAEAME